jgi:hypothetical protein
MGVLGIILKWPFHDSGVVRPSGQKRKGEFTRQVLAEPSQLGKFEAWQPFVFNKLIPKVCTTF